MVNGRPHPSRGGAKKSFRPRCSLDGKRIARILAASKLQQAQIREGLAAEGQFGTPPPTLDQELGLAHQSLAWHLDQVEAWSLRIQALEHEDGCRPQF